MNLMRTLSIALILATALTLACSKSTPNDSQTTNKSLPKAQIDPATAATITGTVNFTGTPPAPQKLDMSMDPSCSAKDTVYAPISVDNGHLADAFVYIKSRLPEAQWDPPATEATLDQNGCRYHPHVLAIMTGQKLKILNSDATTHNIHPMPQVKGNREWNQSQGPHADPIIKTSFNAQEIMIPIKCNQHPWMKMYINVLSHPYFAVTGPDGKFTIPNLPSGTYTLAVVHEKLPEQTLQISVGPKQNKSADFSYSSASPQ
jgi:plastocyanin